MGCVLKNKFIGTAFCACAWYFAYDMYIGLLVDL